MREQTQSAKQKTELTKDIETKAKPYIKVTTVKYLAQLLGGADFVSAKFAVETLSTLFKVSTHIDIQAAIVESLLEILGGCQNDEASISLGNQILEALESTIPVAARLHERYPLEDEDWEKAKETGKLPAIYEQGGRPLAL